MVWENVMEAIVKYISIGKQKVVLFPKLRENQREAAAIALCNENRFKI
jgi:hypothetical protein